MDRQQENVLQYNTETAKRSAQDTPGVSNILNKADSLSSLSSLSSSPSSKCASTLNSRGPAGLNSRTVDSFSIHRMTNRILNSENLKNSENSENSENPEDPNSNVLAHSISGEAEAKAQAQSQSQSQTRPHPHAYTKGTYVKMGPLGRPGREGRPGGLQRLNLNTTEAIKEYCRPNSTLAPRKGGTYPYAHPVQVSRWVLELFPAGERVPCLRALLLLGIAKHGSVIQVPQHHLHCPNGIKPFMAHPILEDNEYDRLWEFGKEAGIQKYALMARTAIMAGLEAPGWELGGCEPYREDPFSLHEWVYLLCKAGVRPKRPDLIPEEVYREIEIEPENVQALHMLYPPPGAEGEVRYG